MAHPKRKTSKSKVRMRVRAHKKKWPMSSTCSQCGAPQLPHRVCSSCGSYRGRQVLVMSAED